MENDLNICLGDIWKQTRKAKGFTQEYAAEQLQLGSRYISDLERDKTLGSITTLVKLCNLYKVTPTYILQNYLQMDEDLKVDKNLIGFYSLDKKNQEVIIKLIEYMNSQ